MELSDDIIQGLTLPAETEKRVYTSPDVSGLQLIVSWKGDALRNRPKSSQFNRDWYFRFQKPNDDRRRRAQMKIGSWPTMNFDSASEEGRRLRELLNSGIDPRVAKLKQRAERIETAAKESGLVPVMLRFEEVMKQMRQDWKKTGRTPDTMRRYRQALEKYALPLFLGRNIRSITGNEWDDMIADIANEKKLPGAANNVHKAGRRLFSYAVQRQLIRYNPLLQRQETLRITRLTPDERFLEAEEVHTFLSELDNQTIPAFAKVYLKLMLYVGVRVDEWARVRVGWINFKRMRIEHPAESMKNRQAAWTHLPGPALTILYEWLQHVKEVHGSLQPDWFLFGADDNPVFAHPQKLSDFTSGMKAWLNFSPKLLRKTMSTHLQRQGCPPAVLRAIRNQSVTEGVESHYDFDDLFHLKKQWVDQWVELLETAKTDYSVLVMDRESRLDSEIANQFDDLFN